jgi:Domain of unknown function (DUF2382)/PRC-barrel domain
MPPVDIDTALDWRGRTVVDREGDKIGTFDELYLDEADRPAWAAVTTGLFGMRQTFVPLAEAQDDGDALRVPFGKDMVKDAPQIDPDAQLNPEEEAVLYRHYGLRADRDDAAEDEAVREESVRDEPVADAAPDRDVDRNVDRDRDPDVDTAEAPRERAAVADAEGGEMIRSEEEVEVGARRRVAGKARLKKYVVTEHVQKVVPVQREEVRVEFEPAESEGEREEERER